jgi:hypothetical protein
MADGKDESAAYAICTTSLKEAGHPIFEAAADGETMDDMRHLHLYGALGATRTVQHEGREHLVVPVVALMEGVIHAINAATPEFVPAETLALSPHSWNGRHLVLGHPAKAGRQISANDPSVLESQSFGQIFNTRYENKRLLMDAYIDPAKAEKIGGAKMLERLRNGEMVEVSVGAFVTTDNLAGEHNGKPYKARWQSIAPDHLAFLPDGRGACSIEMGCGAHRSAEESPTVYDVTDEGLTVNDIVSLKVIPKGSKMKMLCLAASDQSYDDRRAAVDKALNEKFSSAPMVQPSSMGVYASTLFDDHVIVRKDDKLWSVDYTIGADGDVTFTSEPVEVKMAYVAAAMMDCPMCEGTGQKDGNPCPACAGNGEMKAAAGARHSATDKTMIQDMHDRSVALGADCAAARSAGAAPVVISTIQPALEPLAAAAAPTLKAACCCQEGEHMTPDEKTAIVKLLVENKHSGFTAGDEPMLVTASDERLEAFRVAADAREKASETLKAAAAKPLTEEDFMKVAPADLKSLLERQRKQETEYKTDLVATLKAAQSEYSETELSNMSIESLERLSRVAGADVQPSYAGRGVPRAAADTKSDVFLNAPDPYAPGLAAMRAAAGKH